MEITGNAEKKVSFLKIPSRVPKKKRKCVSLFKKSTWGDTDCLYDKSLASSTNLTHGFLTEEGTAASNSGISSLYCWEECVDQYGTGYKFKNLFLTIEKLFLWVRLAPQFPESAVGRSRKELCLEVTSSSPGRPPV